MKMSLRRKIFYGMTLAVVAALLVLPATQWLALRQLAPWTLPTSGATAFGDEATKEQNEKETEARFQKLFAQPDSNTLSTRFAHGYAPGYNDKDSVEILRRLNAVNADYPNRPEVIAAILKTSTASAVKIHRWESDLETPAEHAARIAEYPASKREEKSDPATVARFVTLAEQGEMLEPRNAFFPVMIALGEFARENDDAAIAAWKRAAQRNEWESHDREIIAAQWATSRAMNGGRETGAMDRLTSLATIPFPMYATLRSSARMAVYMAWQAELRGDKETGFALRQATRQVGATVQHSDGVYIGNLVGMAVAGISSSRFPGSEGLTNPYKGGNSSEKWSAEKRERYAAYLRGIGQPGEATAFLSTLAEGKGMKALWYNQSKKTYYGFEDKAKQWLGAWCAGFLLLAGVLFSLVFAGIFKLVYRFSPRLQKGEPLQPSARWGIAAGLFLPIVGGAIALSAIGLWLEPDTAVLTGFVIAVATIAVPPFVMRLGGRGFAHGLRVLLATWASLAALIAAGYLCYLSARGVTEAVGWMTVGFPSDDAAERSALQTVAPWVVGLAVLCVPLGLLALFGVFSKILRVPFAAGVTRGMRSVAVPLAAVLTLLWAGAFVVTLRHENAAIAEMKTMNAIGEKQYMETMTGAMPQTKGDTK